MLIKSLLSFFLLFLITQTAYSQQKNIHWWNPKDAGFPVVAGQGWHKGLQHFYDRLPAKAKKKVRKPVWRLAHETSGLQIRFRTNAADIYVRYTVGQKLSYPHMPATGKSGVDLYAMDRSGNWQWEGGLYQFADTIQYHFVHLQGDYSREYHLYLPLYNDVKWLEIGVPDSAKFTALPLPSKKPIVVYGTSGTQGAVASRPGMSWTNILSRRLYRPVINLGFSGNGRLEKSVADLLTDIDAKIYVVDCLPNVRFCPRDTIATRLANTVTILRNKKPDVPVIIAEDAHATINTLNRKRDSIRTMLNKVADSVFAQLKASGMQKIYLLTADEIELDIESTVDGHHPNAYGMRLYAKAYNRIIRRLLLH